MTFARLFLHNEKKGRDKKLPLIRFSHFFFCGAKRKRKVMEKLHIVYQLQHKNRAAV